MTTNKSIKCRVDSCKYNDKDEYCTLEDIVVGKNCACAKDCCETEFFPLNMSKVTNAKMPYKIGAFSLYIFYNFIVREILPFLASTLKTFTSTISPTETASSGCFINLSQICEI